ncbi:MAG: YtfJ family protein [Pseudomonadota bacterium]
MRKLIEAILIASVFVVASTQHAIALGVGDTVENVQVRDANDKPAAIPDLGKKVIALFYTDPDEKEQNEPFREMLKLNKFDRTRYRGMGIANLKDTWKPNFLVRKIIRRKIEKFKSLILTDPDHILKNKWDLGDCNEKDVVIIIGKDKKVYYIKKGPMTNAEKHKGIDLVRELMKK